MGSRLFLRSWIFSCVKKKSLKDKLNTSALLPISIQNAFHCQFYEFEKLNLLHNVLCVSLLNILKYNSELLFTSKKITELTPQKLLQANGNVTGLNIPLRFCFITFHGLFIIVYFRSGEARYEICYPSKQWVNPVLSNWSYLVLHSTLRHRNCSC